MKDAAPIFRILYRLCAILNITNCPPVVMKPYEKDRPLCVMNFDDYVLEISDCSYCRGFVFEAACALRRLYQVLHEPSLVCAYRKRGEISDEDFALQPSQVDAAAFALLFLKIQFDMKPELDGYSSNVRLAIMNRMYELQLRDDILTPPLHNRFSVSDFLNMRLEYAKSHRKRYRPIEFDSDLYTYWYPREDMLFCDIPHYENTMSEEEMREAMKIIYPDYEFDEKNPLSVIGVVHKPEKHR